MNPVELRRLYRRGRLAKPDYIDRMNERHRLLHDYAGLLQGTEIASVELAPGRVLMTTRDGVRLRCRKDDKRIAPLEMLNFGALEPAEMEMALRLLRDGQTVLDVGANIGWYSLSVSKRFPKAEVHAFEPIPATFRELSENIRLNQACRVHAHNLGFTDTRGKKIFYFHPKISVNASAADLTGGKGARRLACRVERLDDFVRRRRLKMGFLKCDVEGGELAALRGGMETLRRDRPAIQIELLRKWSARFGYHPNDVLDLLAGIGYRCFTARGRRLRPFRRVDESTVETNFFFLHPDRPTSLPSRRA